MPPRPTDLAVSVVVHDPDPALLAPTLEALGRAVARAREAGELARCRLLLVDHAPRGGCAPLLTRLGRDFESAAGPDADHEVVAHGDNPGFGAGHNRALARCAAPFHLVLNPDAVMEEDALAAGLAFLRARPRTAAVSPWVDTGPGGPRHLLKADPDPWTLFLRGFAPARLRRRAARRLDAYALADLDPERVHEDVPHASGCFLLCRREALAEVGGFDERFFLYFEDLDLCRELRARGWRIAFAPTVRIRHHAGGAARKGLRHARLFATSAWRFFRKHGRGGRRGPR